jgi:hypothetical protein
MLRARRALLVFILGLMHGNRCITMPTFAPFLKNAEPPLLGEIPNLQPRGNAACAKINLPRYSRLSLWPSIHILAVSPSTVGLRSFVNSFIDP